MRSRRSCCRCGSRPASSCCRAPRLCSSQYCWLLRAGEASLLAGEAAGLAPGSSGPRTEPEGEASPAAAAPPRCSRPAAATEVHEGVARGKLASKAACTSACCASLATQAAVRPAASWPSREGRPRPPPRFLFSWLAELCSLAQAPPRGVDARPERRVSFAEVELERCARPRLPRCESPGSAAGPALAASSSELSALATRARCPRSWPACARPQRPARCRPAASPPRRCCRRRRPPLGRRASPAPASSTPAAAAGPLLATTWPLLPCRGCPRARPASPGAAAARCRPSAGGRSLQGA